MTAYVRMLEWTRAGQTDIGKMIRGSMSDPALRARGEEVASYIRKTIQEAERLDSNLLKIRRVFGRIDEVAVLRSAVVLIEKEFGAKVEVYSEDDPQKHDPDSRSSHASPFRPAIYVE